METGLPLSILIVSEVKIIPFTSQNKGTDPELP